MGSSCLGSRIGFAIVISIPLIVRAATAVKPDEDVALSYWKGKRKNVNEVNSYGKTRIMNTPQSSITLKILETRLCL